MQASDWTFCKDQMPEFIDASPFCQWTGEVLVEFRDGGHGIAEYTEYKPGGDFGKHGNHWHELHANDFQPPDSVIAWQYIVPVRRDP